MGPKHSKESQEGDSSPRSADDSRDPRSADADGGLNVPKQKKKVKKIGDYQIFEDKKLGSGAEGGTFICKDIKDVK